MSRKELGLHPGFDGGATGKELKPGHGRRHGERLEVGTGQDANTGQVLNQCCQWGWRRGDRLKGGKKSRRGGGVDSYRVLVWKTKSEIKVEDGCSSERVWQAGQNSSIA